jgi:cytochrome c biogenesis protein CcmG, thiol:disulfide interchange protein DsbE
MSARTFVVFGVVLAVVGLLGFGLVSKNSDRPAIGDPVPVAELPNLAGSGSGSLADYRGRWVLINVWASWCGPCRVESPALESISQRNPAKLTVLGIDTRDLTEDGRDFVAELEISYPQLRDGDGDYAEDLGTTGVPESFLVDPAGKLVAHFPGAFRDEEAIAGFVTPALEGRA